MACDMTVDAAVLQATQQGNFTVVEDVRGDKAQEYIRLYNETPPESDEHGARVVRMESQLPDGTPVTALLIVDTQGCMVDASIFKTETIELWLARHRT